MDLGLLRLRPDASRDEVIKVYNDAVSRLKKYAFNQDKVIEELNKRIAELEEAVSAL